MKFMRENQKKTMRDNPDDNRKGELKNEKNVTSLILITRNC